MLAHNMAWIIAKTFETVREYETGRGGGRRIEVALTLYGPRFSTMQVKTASRPTDTVRLLSGVPNLGKSATRKILVLSIPSTVNDLHNRGIHATPPLPTATYTYNPGRRSAVKFAKYSRNLTGWMGRVNVSGSTWDLSQPASLYFSAKFHVRSIKEGRVGKRGGHPSSECPNENKGTREREMSKGFRGFIVIIPGSSGCGCIFVRKGLTCRG